MHNNPNTDLFISPLVKSLLSFKLQTSMMYWRHNEKLVARQCRLTVIRQMSAFFTKKVSSSRQNANEKHPSHGNMKSLYYMSYQLGSGSLERRTVKVESTIAEFHHIDAPTP